MDSKVSAIVTTYKREAPIVCEAIESIKKQTYKNVEIILVDDNGDDNYKKTIQELARKEKIKYLSTGHKGACAARNCGINNASGDYVGFLDDDDLWMEDKIEKQINVFKKYGEEVGMVYCSGIQVDKVNNITKDYYNFRRKLIKENTTLDDLIANDIIGSTSQPLIRKKCFDVVGGFMENQPARQDYEMWLRISTQFKIVGLNEKLFVYNKHNSEQITKSDLKSNVGYRNIFKKYFKYIIRNKEGFENISKLIYKTTDKKNIALTVHYGLIRAIAKINLKLR